MSIIFGHMLFASAPTSNPGTALVLSIIGAVAAPVGAFAAARYAANKSAKSAKDTVSVTEKQLDYTVFDGIVKNLQGEAERLNKRVTDFEARDVASNERITANRARIDTLEDTGRETETKYRLAIEYCKAIIAWVKAIFKSDEVPPAPPEEIAADLK